MIWLNLPPEILLLKSFLVLIDILILTYVFYKFYQILAQTKAVQVLKGLIFFFILYIISRITKLETFSWVLDQIAGVIVIAVIIVFQPELRRVLTKLGQSNWLNSFIKKDPKDLTAILNAVQNFHIRQIGALIVFERSVGLKNIIESGTVIEAEISTSLLLTIFTNKTPLHDGAIIIKNDQIVAAGCFLPLSETTQISQDLGTRHRAALGLAEESDALIIVVSEETGRISLAYDGKLYTNYEIDVLRKELSALLGYEEALGEKADDKAEE
jgi:diadenylate cyclase